MYVIRRNKIMLGDFNYCWWS